MSAKKSSGGNEGGGGYGGYYGGYYYGEGYSGYAEGPGGGTPNRSIGDYLVILRERIWWLVVTVFVVFLGFALYTFNAPKVYRAVASVEVLRQKDQVFQMQDVVRQEVANAEDFNTQMKVLESLGIVQEVDARLKGEMRARFLAPYEKGLDAALRGTRSVAEIIYSNRTIAPVRLSLVVNILYSHPDPEIAALVANLIAEEYIDFNRNKQIEGSLRAVDDLRNQADQQLSKIKEMELRIADFKERHGTVSFEAAQDIENQQLIGLNARFEQDKQIYDEAKTRIDLIERSVEQGDPLYELPFIGAQPQVAELLNRVSGHKIEIATLGKRFRAKHPTMIAAIEQLEQTERELTRAVNAAVATVRNEYARATTNFENSKTRLDQKQEELIRMDRLRPEYNALMRDLEISKELYNHYYSRLQQASVQVTNEGETARIIDSALAPIRPFKPNIKLNLIIGLVLGGGLGLGFVFLLAVLDDKVKSAFDIETSLGIPLIGIVPRITNVDDQTKAKVVLDGIDRHTVEAFRGIHSTLKLNEESKNAKVILTTSTIPSEGKTFVSTNMAITLAQHGEKVIVVDGDLRMPNVAKSLALGRRQGILQYLAGEAELDDVILKGYADNLDVLTTGSRSKSPTQALGSQGFANMIHELRMRYDKIIIDSPPLAPVSDVLNLLPLVDGVVYVIRFNIVKRKTAMVNLRRLKESNTPIFGAVLNNLNTSVAGYYYSHYYDNSYKSYYLKDTRPQLEEPAQDVAAVAEESGPGLPKA